MKSDQVHQSDGLRAGALRLSEVTLQAIFQNVFFGMVIVGSDGTFLRANEAACDLFGYSQDELSALTFSDITYPEDLEAGAALFAQLMRGERSHAKMEKRYVRKDGRVIWTLLSTSAILSSSGEPRYLVTLFQDITERKQSELDLADLVSSKTRDLATLVDVANVASSSLDLNEVLSRSLDSVLSAMACDIGAVHLLDESKTRISLTSWKNVPAEVLEEIQTLPTIRSLPGRILAQHRPLIVSDMLLDPDAVPASKRILGRRVYLGVPMRAQETDIGVLVVIGQAGRVFSEAEVALLSSIAQQIAVAVENAQLHENTEALAITLERQRLAREIHDTLAQGFTGIKLQLEAIESALDIGNAELARQRLGRARYLAEQSLAEARRSVWALRSESLLQKALGAALRDSVRGLTAGSGLVVNIGVQDDLPGLAPDLQTDLLRVAQEAVMNVVKHAEATTLTLRLTFEDQRLCLSVEDDGKGIVPAEMGRGRTDRGGFGMIAMEERASRHGGSLRVRSAPACGTLVTCEVEIGA